MMCQRMTIIMNLWIILIYSHRVHAWTVAVQSIRGSDPNRPQKVNQDAFFTTEYCNLHHQQHFTVGVLDGHGIKGHVLSQYLADIFPTILRNVKPVPELETQIKTMLPNQDATRNEHWLVHAFHQAHYQAMQEPTVNAGRNGATCIVGVWDDQGNVQVACVGDSRAIRVTETNEYCTALTTETTVHVPEERARIERANGTIRGGNVFYGPQGIAMTRALGDCVMLRAGVIPTPTVATYQHIPESTYVFATDGVWEVLNNTQVADLVRQHSDNLDQACTAIVEASRRAWVSDLPLADEIAVDDITCLLVK